MQHLQKTGGYPLKDGWANRQSIRENPVQQFRSSPDSVASSAACTTDTTRLRYDIGVRNLSPQDRFPTPPRPCHAETEIGTAFRISTMLEVCATEQTAPQSTMQYLSVQDRELARFQTRSAGLGESWGIPYEHNDVDRYWQHDRDCHSGLRGHEFSTKAPQ